MCVQAEEELDVLRPTSEEYYKEGRDETYAGGIRERAVDISHKEIAKLNGV